MRMVLVIQNHYKVYTCTQPSCPFKPFLVVYGIFTLNSALTTHLLVIGIKLYSNRLCLPVSVSLVIILRNQKLLTKLVNIHNVPEIRHTTPSGQNNLPLPNLHRCID